MPAPHPHIEVSALSKSFTAGEMHIAAVDAVDLLDSATGKEIVELLLKLNAQHGMTMAMAMATHEVGIATRCARTLGMLDGRIAG